MIRLRRDDKMTVYLVCDRDGLAQLAATLRNDLEVDERHLEVTFDRSVVTLRRRASTVLATLVIEAGDSTRLSLNNGNVVLTITEEDRECMLSRIENCDVEGAFVPAELIRLQVEKNANLDYLYGELVQGSGNL